MPHRYSQFPYFISHLQTSDFQLQHFQNCPPHPETTSSSKVLEHFLFLDNMTLVTKNFMITEESVDHMDSGAQFDLDKNKEAGSDKGCQKTDLKLGNDMSAIDLFRKYLAGTQHNNANSKTSFEEPEITKRSPPRALLPPKPGSNGSRPISFLERGLLPAGISCETTDDKSSANQLTIFYAGTVNVFDNIPAEKAQAIMLLAGENAISTSVVAKSPKPQQQPVLNQTNLPSICKLQAELPVARRRSIQSFLKKRRDRIVHKTPYDTCGNDDVAARNGGSKGTNQIFRPSPFPSRLGFFFSVPANKGKC